MSGLGNYIIFGQDGWKEVTYIPLPSNNEGSGLLLEGYEGWYMGRPFLRLEPSPKERVFPYSIHTLMTSIPLIIFFFFFWPAYAQGKGHRIPSFHYAINLNDQLGRLCVQVR